MSELLKSGNIGNTVFKNLAAQRKAIVANWQKSGLLEGLNTEIKPNIAQLLESEASSLLNDTHDAGLIEYYEERCHKNILRGNFLDAAYYNRKMIYSIEDKILNKYCS